MPTLDFKGKQIIYAHHLTVSGRTLKIDAKKSLPPPPPPTKKPGLDGNLIIHGDNLHALKALMPRYAGRVNCIYIDPPYNTGNEKWLYNDNVNSPTMRDWLKNKSPVDGEDLERHDKWLCMMWPRLQLLRELLAEDGVIFISIDDNEQHHLRMMMDEVFGEENFVQTFTWVKRDKASGVPPKIMVLPNFEYVICYKKSRDIVFSGQNRSLKSYRKNKDGRWWRTMPIQATGDQNNYYSITNPKTNRSYYGNWAFAESAIKRMISEERIVFPKSASGKPNQIVYADEKGLAPILAHLGKIDVETATKDFAKIFEKRKAFDFPKPVELLKLLINQSVGKNDVVLDSFAGSGTTAHAVLALNQEDGGNRKFILVECEDYAHKITAERVRRVIKGVPKSKDENLKNGLGGAFTYCTLGDEISIEKMLTGKHLPDYETFARHLVYVATGKSPDKIRKARGKDGFFLERPGRLFYLIYEPKLTFLRSANSALNADRADRIAKQAKTKKKTALVFATHKFMGQKELTDMNITFCQLPFVVSGG